MGFDHVLTIAAQTYTRKQDIRLFSVLSGLAASAHKLATDLRLLAHLKEMEEPFTKHQVGSSAMPYKRNPILSERICGLARFLISLNENPLYTASTQWLERSLDDSSNRRLALAEGFLTADALLNLLAALTSGLVVYPKMIEKHLQEELPFLATENILMEAVKRGKDRQELHEKLRQHSLAASRRIKEEGLSSDLLDRISKDPSFGLSTSDLNQIVNIEQFIGRAPEQVDEFLKSEVFPILKKYEGMQVFIPPLEI
jgi:adenylosuccinate lyase